MHNQVCALLWLLLIFSLFSITDSEGAICSSSR
jgi:hypothetical protein